jgi:hypothetical protein
MAFWLLPMLGYSPWTTAFNVTWLHSSWREVLPPILWPAALLAGGSALVLGGLCIWKREPFPRSVATWWGAIAISLFFYATAYSFHVVDVRFLPFFQLGLGLAAAAGLGLLLARLRAPEVWPVAACLATLPFVQTQVHFIPEWIRWNYSGFEEKAGWPILSELSRRLSGDFRDPRVVYEHSLDHEVLGTVRAFENLPLFSGRSTLEGLYMQSSVTTPFVFYLQSEISKEISCPLPNWGCTRLHLDRGVEHLRMFNVSQFIVRSDEVKQAARRHPGLSREAEVGAYEIYAVRDNAGRYAVPLESAPVLVRARDWKVAAYQWFKRSGPRDPVAVFAEDVSAEEARAFAGDFSDLPSELPRSPLGAPPQLGEQVETDRITLSGCRPGHPVLVRVSYHPRWRATTGERIFLAGPSFMLVIPRGERVELAFEAGPVLGAGRVLTALGGFLALVGIVPAARRRVGSRVHALAESGALAPLLAPVRRSAAWSEPTRRWLLAGALGVTLLTLGGFVGATLRSNAEDFYREGVELYGDDRLRDSLPFFRETQRLAPLSASAYHARYFEAMVYFREEQWSEAEKRFRTIVESFPEAPNAPEALYHLGLARARLGNHAEAADAWRETVRRFPEVQWAVHARARLAEVGLAP